MVQLSATISLDNSPGTQNTRTWERKKKTEARRLVALSLPPFENERGGEGRGRVGKTGTNLSDLVHQPSDHTLIIMSAHNLSKNHGIALGGFPGLHVCMHVLVS